MSRLILSLLVSTGIKAPWGKQVALIHLLAGVKKKWYANSLVFTLGLRGGVGVYTVGDSHMGGTPIGLGGDAVLGLEYYIMPACGS